MIGYNHLGKNGRLGNQMFQYATTRGIAAKKGYDFIIPDSDFRDQWNDHQLFDAFEMTGSRRGGIRAGFNNSSYRAGAWGEIVATMIH